jgi:hypothetical protein
MPIESTVEFVPEPTRTEIVAAPVRSDVPLNLELVAIRSISSTRSWNSASSVVRSVADIVPVADSTASSRRRMRMPLISSRAPSAVWTSEMPSFAFRWACWRLRICARIRSEIASPAASSDARAIRRPDDSRPNERLSAWLALLQVPLGRERGHVGVDSETH